MVQENHGTVKRNSKVASRGMKTYSKSRIELQSPQILKKILEKSTQFLSSEQPCEPKSLEVALKVAGVEEIHSKKLRLRSTLRRFEFELKERWSFSNQFEIVSETTFSCDKVGREL